MTSVEPDDPELETINLMEVAEEPYRNLLSWIDDYQRVVKNAGLSTYVWIPEPNEKEYPNDNR